MSENNVVLRKKDTVYDYDGCKMEVTGVDKLDNGIQIASVSYDGYVSHIRLDNIIRTEDGKFKSKKLVFRTGKVKETPKKKYFKPYTKKEEEVDIFMSNEELLKILRSQRKAQ